MNNQKSITDITSFKIIANIQSAWKNKMKFLVILFSALCFSLSLSACQHRRSDDGSGKEITAPGKAERSATIQASLPRHQTPDLTVQDMQGNILTLSELKGKVVFINFWATWCPPCREEMPTIQKLRTHFKNHQNIVFLMIDIDGRLEASSKYLEKNGYDLPVYKAQGAIPSQFLGDAIPTTVILDKAGEVVARVEGARDYGTAEVFNEIEQLLNK
ncbi:TlpA family protein disulfide reductase [Arachidicoccus terrestris]|uniref:TlpA family protein disulfide reductase n=1 Tax=Arachidicoccus terrestris TaxID=2875539 RepID=UPI001CC33F7B|nr:TlpA disulfide reductase family protein [Arachidicoccus terrestris]UAY55522.1 TlpA family protein disulfide reductase [Arachidicoccus terrestris]